MDMDWIDEMVTVGDTEIWEVTHAGGSPHNFHVHDVQLVVHTLDGGRPPSAMQGWKDTVYVPPDSTVRLLLRFSDYTDPEAPLTGFGPYAAWSDCARLTSRCSGCSTCAFALNRAQ